MQSGQSPHAAIRHKERGQSSSSTSLGVWPDPNLIDKSDAHVSGGHLLSILSDSSICGQTSRTFFRINSKCLLSSRENHFQQIPRYRLCIKPCDTMPMQRYKKVGTLNMFLRKIFVIRFFFKKTPCFCTDYHWLMATTGCLNIPTVGMHRSHTGNESFPRWE